VGGCGWDQWLRLFFGGFGFYAFGASRRFGGEELTEWDGVLEGVVELS